jgi:transcriptional regulator with XRE-family HTH domain
LPDQPSRVRLQLAAELQTARTLSGINQRDLATRLGISQSLVSRAERAERLLSRPDTLRWLRTTKARDDVRDRVLALTEAAHTETRTWADLLASQQHLQEQSRERNRTARLMQDFSPTVLPGLLQTADYARRIIPLADITGQIDHAASLAARIQRQSVLTDDADRTFQFLIAERLLSWEPAPGVLSPQLAQLLAAAKLDTVDLAVLPDSYAGALPWHNFVLRYPADGSPAYVAAELVHGAQTIDDPESVQVYQELWSRMWEAAATGEDALDIIRAKTSR